MELILRASIVSCLLPSAALAQTQTVDPQGMMSNAAVGIVTKNASPGSQLVIRVSGPATQVPTGWTSAAFGAATAIHPDYSSTPLLNGFNLLEHTGPGTSALDFGGFSTGGDFTPPSDSSGRLILFQSWYLLSVTVGGQNDPSHVFGAPNSVLSTLMNPQQSIISYYLEGSTGIDEGLVDETLVEQTSAQLFYQPPAGITVVGLDWPMGAISGDALGTRSQRIAPVRDQFYFGVTDAWLVANASSQFKIEYPVPPSTSGPKGPLNSRTIYKMTWLPNLTWSMPTVAFSSLELFGSDNPPVHKEIDAISVYTPPAEPLVNRVVFSTTLASGSPDELLVFDRGVTTVAQTLKTGTGVLVSDKLGLFQGTSTIERDGITGTCGIDPREDEGVDGTVGQPMGRLGTDGDSPLGLSVYRSISKPYVQYQDRVNFQVTGIELPAGITGQVYFEYGFLTQQELDVLDCQPAYWSGLALVNVQPGASTVNYEFPGNIGFSGPVAIVATLVKTGTSDPINTSWISVLRY